MTIYIALLRGINVGGHHIIKMSELKKAFEGLGLLNVQTYIQSGNVLFQSDEAEEPLRKKIEQEIEATFGFSVLVVLRTAAEWEQMIRDCPFTPEQIAEAENASASESLYVSLMPHAPLQEHTARLNPYTSEADTFRIIGREVYLLFCQSIRNSKLADNLHRLEVPATVRNWKTINKIALMARAMENEPSMNPATGIGVTWR